MLAGWFCRTDRNGEGKPMFPYATLNTSDFSKLEYAREALRLEGFEQLQIADQIWRSADGRVDATIKQRFSDSRFYIVFFA
jgi:hypothetical protein